MSTMPPTTQRLPMTTGRRSSVDQGRSAEKLKSSKSKVIKFFRSSKQNENKGDEDGRDSTAENAQNETKAAVGEGLSTNPNTISKSQGSSQAKGSVLDPSRPSYSYKDSGYSGDGARGPSTLDQTPGGGASIPPPHALPGLTGVGSEVVGTDFQPQMRHTAGSPSGPFPFRPTLKQDRLARDGNNEQSESSPGLLSNHNQLPTSAEIFNENRYLKIQLNEKDQTIETLWQQSDNLRRDYDEVTADYKLSIVDLNTRTEQLRKAKRELEEGKAKWANGAKLEMQLQSDMTRMKTEIEGKDKAFEKWRREAEGITAERDKLRSVQAQFGELETTFNQTLEQLQARNEQLFRARADYEIIKQKHSETSADLLRVKIDSRPDLDDAFFISKYQNLQSDIRVWAQKYFWGDQRKRGVLHSPHNVIQQPSIHDDLEELSEDCLNLLVGSEDGSTRPFVAEAYLWKFIEDKILHTTRSGASCSKGMFWAHKLRPEMVRIEKFLHPGPKASDAELRMFYKWKASTAKLVIRRLKPVFERTRIPVDSAVMNYMVDQVLHVLSEWMSKNEKKPRPEEACRRDLATVLQAAIDFDSHIHEEWSRIFVMAKPLNYEHRYGFEFDNTSMTPGTNCILENRELVGTVISPALVRNGTPDGDYYGEVEEILVSSRVLPQGFWAKTQKPNNSQGGGGVVRGSQKRIRS